MELLKILAEQGKLVELVEKVTLFLCLEKCSFGPMSRGFMANSTALSCSWMKEMAEMLATQSFSWTLISDIDHYGCMWMVPLKYFGFLSLASFSV